MNQSTEPNLLAESAPTRNFGIDALKLFSMFLVVLLHMLSQGALPAAQPMTLNYEAGFLMEALAYCCVNCFALASGYVGVDSRFRHRNILPLWLQVVFYTLLITFVVLCTMPPEFYTPLLGTSPYSIALTPVLHNTYWYFTAYFALFFFIPFFNMGLSRLTERQAGTLILSVLFIYIFVQHLSKSDLFTIGLGYNATWLMILYALGAALKKLNTQKFVKKNCLFLAGYLVFAFLAWGGKYIKESRSIEAGAFVSDTEFLQYTSLFILLSSMSLVLFFARLNIKNKRTQAVIRRLAAASFGVYLIHTHPLFFHLPFWTEMRVLAAEPVYILIFGVLKNAVIVFTLCLAADYVRGLLFKLLRIDRAIHCICDKCNTLINKKSEVKP